MLEQLLRVEIQYIMLLVVNIPELVAVDIMAEVEDLLIRKLEVLVEVAADTQLLV